MTAGLVRALASVRRRPGPTLAAAVGLLLAGVLVGTATTTGVALATGFDRAQRAAGTADVIARFDTIDRAAAEERLAPLANVRRRSYRIVVRPVDLSVGPRGDRRRGTAEVNGLEGPSDGDGLAIVAGRALSGRPGEAVIERGLADAWHVRVGAPIRLGRWRGQVVGIAVEPDNVAFPLAARPRVYLRASDVRQSIMRVEGQPVNAAYLRVVDGSDDALAATLVQARIASYGVTGLGFSTRTGVRALVEEAGGLVGALLVGFAVVALLAAGAMLAAAGHARVTRDLPTLGAARGRVRPAGLAGSYAAEAMLVALPVAAIGVVAGALVVSGPTARLLHGLNELPPPASIGPLHGVAIAGITLLAGLAAGLPPLAAARRPVVETLRGARTARPRRRSSRRDAAAGSGPLRLGARLVAARPGRLLVSVLAVAAAVATILLLLALARFLVEAQREPSAIGERYTLVVEGQPDGDALAAVRATPGVAAAAERVEVRAADVFDLGQPLTLVAFGEGGEDVFAGRPLLEGARARAADETEVGRGLALALGLGVGGELRVGLASGGEVRLRVAGIVQELGSDGRIAYASVAALRAADPSLVAQVAVRQESGIAAATLAERLRERGLQVTENGGLAPAGAPFVGTVVALLRTVAVVDALVCAAIVLLSLVVVARERAETIGVLRAAGADGGQIARLLAGAALALVALAVPVGYAVERWLLAPLLSGLVERYGALPLAPALLDLALVAAGAVVVAVATAGVVAWRLGRLTLVEVLRAE